MDTLPAYPGQSNERQSITITLHTCTCINYLFIFFSFKTNYITPQLLFQCCRGDLYFSPSLSSLSLTSSLPLSLSLCLLPSLGSCDLPSLQHLIGEGLDGYPLVDVLLLWLPEGGRSEGEVNEEVWLMGVVTSLLSIVILESLEESLLVSYSVLFIYKLLFNLAF